jgi:hypothetical protein
LLASGNNVRFPASALSHIHHRQDGEWGEKTIPAHESAALMPGDVVKVASPLAPPSTSVNLPALPDDVSARLSRSEEASQ